MSEISNLKQCKYALVTFINVGQYEKRNASSVSWNNTFNLPLNLSIFHFRYKSSSQKKTGNNTNL